MTTSDPSPRVRTRHLALAAALLTLTAMRPIDARAAGPRDQEELREQLRRQARDQIRDGQTRDKDEAEANEKVLVELAYKLGDADEFRGIVTVPLGQSGEFHLAVGTENAAHISVHVNASDGGYDSTVTIRRGERRPSKLVLRTKENEEARVETSSSHLAVTVRKAPAEPT